MEPFTRLTPLTATIGAEIADVQLSDLVATAKTSVATDLCRLLVRYKVLVFRDQHPGPDTHLAVGQLLGRLAPPQPMYPTVNGFDDIIIIRNDAANPPENEVWHADMSYLQQPVCPRCCMRSRCRQLVAILYGRI
ncbi:MAG: TauD/TfdA family dioxygenase [Candidatus Puniceispirillum sp.]